MSQPRITFQLTPMVWLTVRGQKKGPEHGNRDDGGLVSELLHWLHAQRIFHARVGGTSMPGSLSFGFDPADMPAIAAWLKARGIIEVPDDGPDAELIVAPSSSWKAAEAGEKG